MGKGVVNVKYASNAELSGAVYYGTLSLPVTAPH